jgi:hypothetical protein
MVSPTFARLPSIHPSSSMSEKAYSSYTPLRAPIEFDRSTWKSSSVSAIADGKSPELTKSMARRGVSRYASLSEVDDVRCEKLSHAADNVATVEGFVSAADYVHVLLRHSSRSIPQLQESA